MILQQQKYPLTIAEHNAIAERKAIIRSLQEGDQVLVNDRPAVVARCPAGYLALYSPGTPRPFYILGRPVTGQPSGHWIKLAGGASPASIHQWNLADFIESIGINTDPDTHVDRDAWLQAYQEVLREQE